MNYLSKFFMRGMILVTFLILCCSLFLTNNLTYPTHAFFSLFLSFPILLVWIWWHKKVSPRLEVWTKKQEVIFLCIYFLCFFLIQFFLFQELKVTPGWDFGELYRSALSYVNQEPIKFVAYFEYCPNNIFIYLCYIVLFKIARFFGITNLLNLLGVCNIFLIGFSIFLLFLVAKKLFSKRASYTLLFLILFFSPIFLYVPIIYTDTVSMFVPILLLYLFLQLQNASLKKQWIWIILFAIVTFVGYKLKMSCLIIVIALLIHMILTKKILLFSKITGVLLVSFFSFSFLFQHLILEDEKFHFQDNGVGELPFTHYIMMGLEDPDADHSMRRTYGGFEGADLDYTKALDPSKRKDAHIQEIKRRLHAYTPLELLTYYGNKISNTWGDGTYFAPMKISQLPVKQSFLHSYFLVDGTHFQLYLYFAQGVQYAFLILLFLSSILKRDDTSNIYLYLSIFGLFLFLLIWETRSRYLVNYIPIFLLSIVPALDFIAKKFNKKI